MKIEALHRFIAPLKRKVSVLILKAIVEGAKDGAGVQRIKVNSGNDQITSDVERIQPFGLSSNPEDGAEAVVLSLNGNRDHQVVIQVDDSRYRVKVNKGDIALYNKSGMVIELKREEILLGKGLQSTLTDLDGVITGKFVDTLTGVPLGALPGGNINGLGNSLKLKVEL